MLVLNNSVSISFNNMGFFSSDEKWIHPKRQISTYEIIYVVSGNVYISEENINYALKKNDILILRPGVVHEGYKFSDGHTSYYWVHFKANNISSIIPEFGVVSDFFMNHTFRQLLHLDVSNADTYIKDIIVSYIISEYILDKNTKVTKKSMLVENVLEYIKMNIDANMTVNSVAEYFKYNPQSLSRIVQKHSYANLKSIITDMLLTKATDLLMHSYYTIKEIAFILKFNSSESFSMFFKYHKHISPTQYRNLFTETHMNNK